jgi:hypothetical protein
MVEGILSTPAPSSQTVPTSQVPSLDNFSTPANPPPNTTPGAPILDRCPLAER